MTTKVSTNICDLRDVCYKQIKDNFYYGLFGNFKLVIDKNTGCFNVTKFCKNYNRRYRNWTRTVRARKLLDYYKNTHNITSDKFYEIKGDNNNFIIKQITGQYVPKELLQNIASWISPELYQKIHSYYGDYLVKASSLENKLKEQQFSNTIIEKDNVIAEKVGEIDELVRLSKLREEESRKDREMLLQKMNEQLTTVQTKLDMAIKDRAPQPDQPSKRERFMLLKINDPDYQYYVIRAQDGKAKSVLRRQRASFSEVKILLDFPCHPNTKTMYVRVKEYLKSKNVVFRYCQISLKGSKITETELVKAMQLINDEKANVLPISTNKSKVC